MEHQQTDVRQVSGRAASADDTERFLRELRQLRDGAGLGHAELAARAHYPYDSIKAAEVGPALPDLPVLSAFVRGCGGTAEEWEERWRSLTRTPSLPVSEARDAGGSAAADAGARIGSVSQVTDNPDPSIILAALNRVAEGMASGSDGTASPSDDASLWPDFPPDAAAEPSPPTSRPASSLTPRRSLRPRSRWLASSPTSVGRRVLPRARGPPARRAPGATGGFPSGWDPIRVSTAWPAIPDSPIDVAFSTEAGAEAPPWESAPWAGDHGARTQPPRPAGRRHLALPRGALRAVAARSPGRAASRRGPRRGRRESGWWRSPLSCSASSPWC